MEYRTAFLVLFAAWPMAFVAGIVWLGWRQKNRNAQLILNDSLKALQLIGAQRRGRLWR